MYYFSLLCTLKKAIKNYEVKVDVQKGALRFREKVDNGCVSSNISCHSLLSYASSND